MVIASVGAELQPVAFSNTKVTVPGETPVTTPVFDTVAIPVLLLVHTPPLLGDKVEVSPTQILLGPVTLTTAG